MLGKRMLYKRSVMIAVAVVALMTLSAGVAAADSLKARFTAQGTDISTVGLHPDFGNVEAEFKFKGDDITSINIHTFNEVVSGSFGLDAVTDCKEPKKNGDAVCDAVSAALDGMPITSIHESEAKLKVTVQPEFNPAFAYLGAPEVIVGTLKGKLNATLYVGALTGTADLKIRSTAPATYACFDALGQITGGFVEIDNCQNPGFLLVPVDLHVKDSGSSEVAGAGIELSGNIDVTVDSQLFAYTTGEVTIKKGKAELTD